MGTKLRWTTVVVMTALGFGLAAVSCSGTETDSMSKDASVRDAGAAGGAAPDSADPAGRPAAQPVAAAATPRQLVYTADLAVVVQSVPRATRRADVVAANHGGFVFGQESSAGSDGAATLTLKVPAAEFRALLDELAGLGKEASRSVRTEDVTDASVDLDARLRSAQKSVDRVRAFLDETKNVTELSGVEAELTRRETELEQLTAQRRELDGRVALATITVNLSEKPIVVSATGDPLRKVPGFGSALATGADWLVRAFRLAGAGLGYSLPFLVVLAAVVGLRRLIRRRRGAEVAPAR